MPESLILHRDYECHSLNPVDINWNPAVTSGLWDMQTIGQQEANAMSSREMEAEG
jgi:hypothetical protein